MDLGLFNNYNLKFWYINFSVLINSKYYLKLNSCKLQEIYSYLFEYLPQKMGDLYMKLVHLKNIHVSL